MTIVRNSMTSTRLLGVLAATITATLAMDPAAAQVLAPIERGANIIRDTVTGIALALMTAGVGIAGYKIMFSGASFRDCSNLLIGGAICGGAAALAQAFL